MAAYTVAITLDRPVIQSVAPAIGFLSGIITLNPYSQTKVKITGIAQFFKGAVTVLVAGISSNGWACWWDNTNQWVQAFAPNGNAAAQTEAPEGTNVGVVPFLAFGLFN